MSNKLIIVADAKQAKFYKASGLKIMGQVEVLLAPEPHHSKQDLRQGFNHKASTSSHFFDPHSDMLELERDEFAKTVVARAGAIFERDKCDGLIIVAPSKVLGAVRSHLTKPLKSAILKEIDKELTACNEAVLEQQVFS